MFSIKHKQNSDRPNTETDQPVAPKTATTAVNDFPYPPLPPLRWSQRIALIVFGTFLSLLLLEVGFRVVTYEFPAAPIEKNRPKHYFYPEGTESMRDFRYTFLKPPNTYRIAVIGDSFTFGTALEFDDTFSKRLERWLNLNTGGRKVEVLNLGVPGHSSAAEVQVVKQALRRQSDLILVQITLNDAELEPLHANAENAGFPKKPNLDSPIYRYWKSLAFIRMRIWNTMHQRAYKNYYHNLYHERKTWNRFRQSFDVMKRLAESSGASIGAVVFPVFSHPLGAEYPFEDVHRRIDQMLEEMQLGYLDLRPAFANMIGEYLQILPGEDGHPNEVAHRIAAENIYVWLEQSGLLPKDLYVKNQSNDRVGLPYRLKHMETLDGEPPETHEQDKQDDSKHAGADNAADDDSENHV